MLACEGSDTVAFLKKAIELEFGEVHSEDSITQLCKMSRMRTITTLERIQCMPFLWRSS